MNTLTVGGGCTVTLRVAVAVRPPPSCTVSVSVWAPGARPEVSQLNEAVGPVFEVEKIDAAPPSSRSVQLMVPMPLLSLIPTVTLRVAVAGVRPLPSCTVSVSVWEPVATLDVSHVNDAVGPVFEVEKIGGEPPSSCSVQLIVPVPLVSDMPTVTMPLTAAPSTGVLIDAVSFAMPGTTSVRLAKPVLFTESRPLTVAVGLPPDAALLLQGMEVR